MTDQGLVDVAVIVQDPDQNRALTHALEQGGFTVMGIRDLRAGKEFIARGRPKVVLCGGHLPDGDGVTLGPWLRRDAHVLSPYFMLVTTGSDHGLAARALEGGADDFLTLPLRQAELIARVRVGTRLWTLQHQLRRAAMTDGLTQLYNHDHFNHVLDAEMRRARRFGHPLGLIMLDVDHFKAVNDTFGHLAGNAVLEEIARVLRTGVREVDTVGRFGGEEFAIVLPESTAADARKVADRLRGAIAESMPRAVLHDHVVTASFGVADSEDPRVTGAADLVDLADRALYLAKRRGRNRVADASELTDAGELPETGELNEVEWLRRRVAALSVRAKDVYVQSVASLLQALDEKDPYTGRHAVNVAFYAQQLGEQLGLSRATVKNIHNAALLHDIGKVGVPDRILMKQTPLTPLERMVINQAPLIGTRIVDHLRILEAEIQIIRHQREYYDGSGSPSRLKGAQIPVGSRVLLVADAFDAMTTDRVYRERRSIPVVLDEMNGLAGRQFDPEVVKALQSLLDENLAVWQARIEDTIHSLRLPASEESTVDSSRSASVHKPQGN